MMKLTPKKYLYAPTVIFAIALAPKGANADDQSKDMIKPNNGLCIEQGVEIDTSKCTALKNQSQLKTEKLSPQIRTKDLKKSEKLNIGDYSAFTHGYSK